MKKKLTDKMFKRIFRDISRDCDRQLAEQEKKLIILNRRVYREVIRPFRDEVEDILMEVGFGDYNVVIEAKRIVDKYLQEFMDSEPSIICKMDKIQDEVEGWQQNDQLLSREAVQRDLFTQAGRLGKKILKEK